MKSFDALPAPCRSFLLFWMFTLLVAELYLLVRNTIQRAPQGRYPLSIFMIGAHLFFCKSSPRATAALWPCSRPEGWGTSWFRPSIYTGPFHRKNGGWRPPFPPGP